MRKYLLLAVPAAAIIIGLGWLTFGGRDAREPADRQELRSIRKIREQKRAERARKLGHRAEKIVLSGKTEHVKPVIDLDLAEEEKLSEEMKALYRELQQALDSDDKRRVFAQVQKLQASKEWPDGIPKSVKMKALEALSWFGAAGASEAISFLGDSDPEIVEMTIEKFDEMLCDMSLGDRGVSEILKQLVTVVHDHDALDSFYMEMNNMRSSVRVETALAIFDSKNPDAISVLNDNLEYLFSDNEGNYEVKTRSDVERYGKDNPDGEDAEAMYGPS